MDTKYAYSATTNAFYPKDLYPSYESAGTLPTDLIDVETSVFVEFTQIPPTGKVRVSGKDGLPAWGDIPPPPSEDVIQANIALKAQLMGEASSQIDMLTDAIDPNIMGDDIDPIDVTNLKLWKAYRVKLSRVTDMLNPVWPDKPNA